MLRFWFSVGFAAALYFLILLLIYLVEYSFLETWWEVQPKSGVRQKEWLDNFAGIAWKSATFALFGVVLWYVTGYFLYRVKYWNGAKKIKIVWWAVLFSTLALAVGYGWFYTDLTQDKGNFAAYVLYFLNAGFIYFLSSTILSPPTVKYAPAFSTFFASFGNLMMRPFSRG